MGVSVSGEYDKEKWLSKYYMTDIERKKTSYAEEVYSTRLQDETR